MEEKILKDAQYRKGLSIAFFNATNSAIALVANRTMDMPDALKEVVRIRDILLEEHKNYYATVIANIGANYKATDTIEKLSKTKNIDELKSLWLSLSEDERRDGEILKAKETNPIYLKFKKTNEKA